MKKYILFIDESGDPSLRVINPIFPIFTLMGVLISEDEYKIMSMEIDSLKNIVFGTTKIVFHSRDIRKCDGNFAILFNPKIKEFFYQRLDDIFIKYDYILVASIIKKQEYIGMYGNSANDPYEIGLTFLLERILFDLDSKNGFAEVVLESRGKREDLSLRNKYRQLITNGSRQIGAERFSLRFNTEVIFRCKSMNDTGLQIADLCAYPTSRHILPGPESPSFMVIQDKFRKSNRGQINGYGIKIFPAKQ